MEDFPAPGRLQLADEVIDIKAHEDVCPTGMGDRQQVVVGLRPEPPGGSHKPDSRCAALPVAPRRRNLPNPQQSGMVDAPCVFGNCCCPSGCSG